MFIFLFLVIIICLLVIAWVVVKKLPDLRIVRAESNQEDKHNDLKKALIEKRIKRQLSSLTDEAIKTLKPAAKSLKDIFYSWLLKLRRKEDEYRHKLLHNDFQDEVNKERKISQLMLEVEENMNNDQLALAEAKLIDILKLDEHYQEAYFVLAKLYRQQKDYEHAIEIYNYLLKISTQPEIYRNLAAVAEERGNLKEAEENYLQAIKLDDQRAETYADLAKLYLEQEESAKALESIQQAVVLNPKNPKFLDFLLQMSIIVQDKKLANDAWQQLAEANGENNKLAEYRELIDELK